MTMKPLFSHYDGLPPFWMLCHRKKEPCAC
jgi:hypothetical protein